jgi:hypothetical protein
MMAEADQDGTFAGLWVTPGWRSRTTPTANWRWAPRSAGASSTSCGISDSSYVTRIHRSPRERRHRKDPIVVRVIEDALE